MGVWGGKKRGKGIKRNLRGREGPQGEGEREGEGGWGVLRFFECATNEKKEGSMSEALYTSILLRDEDEEGWSA